VDFWCGLKEEIAALAHELEDIVCFENVSIRYSLSAEVLQEISFKLAVGSFNFITGPSGSGKSSLMRSMYLACRPAQGRISIFGQDTLTLTRDGHAALRRKIGVVFQEFKLINHMSAFDNVALPLRIAGVGEVEIREYVPELLRWVGLDEQLNSMPTTLSRGEQQQVAIARAVIARPQLLLADEPTSSVDSEIAIRLMYLLQELNKNGTTIVVATHNDELVRSFPHPELRIDNGGLSVLPTGSLHEHSK